MEIKLSTIQRKILYLSQIQYLSAPQNVSLSDTKCISQRHDFNILDIK